MSDTVGTTLPQQRGFTLVELMVAMVLGLVVLGGVVNVFLANQQSYRTNQALGNVQDATRVAFELMARDVRGVGMTGCGNAANTITNATNSTAWWVNWNQPLTGYDSATEDSVLSGVTGDGAPVATAGSIQVLSVAGGSASFAVASSLVGGAIELNVRPGTTFPFSPGQIVVVCTPNTALIGQLSAVEPDEEPPSITFAASGSGTPGNSSAIAVAFPINSLVTPLNAVNWYLGTNPVGGTSLYRRTLRADPGAIPVAIQEVSDEMVRDVADIQIQYHRTNDTSYSNVAGVGANWQNVDAVQITLTPQATVGQGSETIARPFTTTVALRGRVD
jgi:type IV pilus assembly protein PilW